MDYETEMLKIAETEMLKIAERDEQATFTPIILETGNFTCNICRKGAVNDYAHLGSVCDACLDLKCRMNTGKPWSGRTVVRWWTS